jgi:hypothetical protein
MREKIYRFLSNHKDYPILLGIASGLYPFIYLYDKNFLLVNSWSQFIFFVMTFLLVPVVCFLLVSSGLNNIKLLAPYKVKILSTLNFSFFTFLIILITFGLNKKKIILASLIVAIVLGILLYKHLKKVMVFQFILALLAFVMLMPSFYNYMKYSYSWQNQPDDIKNVVFKKRPNIYYLQPDGFVGFNQINKGYYKFDNSQIESFLQDHRFKIYDNFRSNYTSTLSSNSSMFSMKHHYYLENQNLDRLYNAREIIAGKNPVVEIFKKNNYKTHLILDVPYLVGNRPNMNYDTCNINYSDIPFLVRGFEFKKNTAQALSEAIETNSSTQNFYFVREPKPGHIQTRKAKSKGVQLEREQYLADLKTSNEWIQTVVTTITTYDPNSIIVISSDHGGFVGFSYTRESLNKTNDKDLIHSMFSSVLAIKWPENNPPSYSNSLKSSVNIFRVLFAYLGEEDRYLKSLEPNVSYGKIDNGAPSGVYELINEQGDPVFNRFSN